MCRFHGARSPQAIRKAAWRASLRDEVARTPARPASQWMADTLHRLGVILLRVERDLLSPPSPEALTEYIDAVLRTHYAAKASMAAGLDEALTSAVSADGERMITMLSAVLDAVGVGLVPELAGRAAQIVPAIIRGERVAESVLLSEAVEARARVRVEKELPRRLEEELRRLRGDGGLLAIEDHASSPVAGSEPASVDVLPDAGAGQQPDVFGAQRGAGRADAAAGEVVDAELVDEEGLPGFSCPACRGRGPGCAFCGRVGLPRRGLGVDLDLLGWSR